MRRDVLVVLLLSRYNGSAKGAHDTLKYDGRLVGGIGSAIKGFHSFCAFVRDLQVHEKAGDEERREPGLK